MMQHTAHSGYMPLDVGNSSSSARATAPQQQAAGASARIKVVFLIDRMVSEMGGTEGQIMKLLRGLQERIDVELVAMEHTPWMSAQVSTDTLRFTVIDLKGGPRRWNFWRGFYRLVTHLRATRADVVHTFFPIANIVGTVAARLARVKQVVGSRRDFGFWMTPGYLAFTRQANRLVDCIVTNAPEVKQLTVDKEGYPADKIEVIFNGVDLKGIQTVEPDLKLKARLGIPAHHKVVTLVANFRPIKRHDTLVSAFAQLCRERDDIHLLLLGSGGTETYIDDVTAQIESLGLKDRVVITQAAGNEMAQYLSIVDVGCNCSESEGLSNAVMEYMGAGIPCVVSRGGGNKDLVSHEVNGLLFDVGDADALAHNLRRLLTDPVLAERLARASLERLQTEMALPVILQRLESIYRRAPA